MKTHSFYLLAVAGGVALFALAAPQPIKGQNTLLPNASPAVEVQAEVSPQVAALIVELTAQNKQLTANQEALDAQLSDIAESVRQARIFVARAGRGTK